uniref:Uncharacterized protein n=1 Tax=Arundo donax TaxID=35708 RepID=A0A0A9FEB0_ARUDO
MGFAHSQISSCCDIRCFALYSSVSDHLSLNMADFRRRKAIKQINIELKDSKRIESVVSIICFSEFPFVLPPFRVLPLI